MAALKDFESLGGRHSDKADFVLIYITEAHPLESSNMNVLGGTGIAVNFAKTMEQKADNARELAKRTKLPIYIDDVTDTACRAYGAFPDRLGKESKIPK